MSNSCIDKMMDTVRTIFDAAQAVVDSIDNGKRKQIKDIAEAVAISVQMEPKKVLSFVNHFVHETDQGYVTRGKNGGFIKGVRPVKPVKPTKVADTTPVAAPSTPVLNDDSDSTEESDENETV